MSQITIGRNAQSTIIVGAEYNTVSGNHATISYDGQSYILQDHSTNGTYINGIRIPPMVETLLTHDAKLRLCNELFIFCLEG